MYENICIVGSSKKILKKKQGKKINHFKEVVRFTRSQIGSFKEYVGTKTSLRILMETENIQATIGAAKRMVNGLSGVRTVKKKLMVCIKMMFPGEDNLRIIFIVMVKLLKNMLNIIIMDKKRLLG